jgi:hypothetical protein
MCCGDTTGDGIVDTCEDPLDDGTCLIGTATDTYTCGTAPTTAWGS